MMIGPAIAAWSVWTIATLAWPVRPISAVRTIRSIVTTATGTIVATAWPITARYIAAARTGWQRAGPVAAANSFAAGRPIAQKVGRRPAGQRPAGNGTGAGQA